MGHLRTHASIAAPVRLELSAIIHTLKNQQGLRAPDPRGIPGRYQFDTRSTILSCFGLWQNFAAVLARRASIETPLRIDSNWIVDETEAAGCVPKLVNSVSLYPISSSASNHERVMSPAFRRATRGGRKRQTVWRASPGRKTDTWIGGRWDFRPPSGIASRLARVSTCSAGNFAGQGKVDIKAPFSAKAGLMEMSSYESGGV